MIIGWSQQNFLEYQMITGDQKARGHFHDDHEALIVEDDAGNLEDKSS